jgi:hypothetical protein
MEMEKKWLNEKFIVTIKDLKKLKDGEWSEEEVKEDIKYLDPSEPGEGEIWSNERLAKAWFKMLNLYVNEDIALAIIEQKIEEEIESKIDHERYIIIKSYLLWKQKIAVGQVEKNKCFVKEELNVRGVLYDELYQFELFYGEINNELIRIKKKNKKIFMERFLFFYKNLLHDVSEVNTSAFFYKNLVLNNVKVEYNRMVLKKQNLRIFESSIMFFFIILLFLFYFTPIDRILFPVFFLFIIYFYRTLITNSKYNIVYFLLYTIIYLEFGFPILYIVIILVYVFFLIFDNFICRLIFILFGLKKNKTSAIFIKKDWKSILLRPLVRKLRKLRRKLRRKIRRIALFILFFIFYFIILFLLNALMLFYVL